VHYLEYLWTCARAYVYAHTRISIPYYRAEVPKRLPPSSRSPRLPLSARFDNRDFRIESPESGKRGIANRTRRRFNHAPLENESLRGIVVLTAPRMLQCLQISSSDCTVINNVIYQFPRVASISMHASRTELIAGMIIETGER
jgi:hypothetical protein